MSGIMMAAMSGGRADVVNPLPGGNATARSSLDDCFIIFYDDGKIDLSRAGTSASGTTSWYLDRTAGIGYNYYIRFTVTSGISSELVYPAGWNDLSVQRMIKHPYNYAQSVGYTITVEIATDSGGSNIVTSSANYTFSFS